MTPPRRTCARTGCAEAFVARTYSRSNVQERLYHSEKCSRLARLANGYRPLSADLLEKSVRVFACPACARVEKARPGLLPLPLPPLSLPAAKRVIDAAAWLLAPFSPAAALAIEDTPDRRGCEREGCDQTFVVRAFTGSRREPRRYCSERCARFVRTRMRRCMKARTS